MSTRIFAAFCVSLCTIAVTTNADAAVSVLGSGPAELCYQAANTGQSPNDYIGYCDQALAGTLSSDDRAATFINRGVLKLAVNRIDSAATDFRAGLAINANLGEGYVDLGATQIFNKKYAEAIRNITKGLALGTNQPHLAYYDRAMADEALGDLKGAYADYSQAATLAPDFTPASDELKRFKVVSKPQGA